MMKPKSRTGGIVAIILTLLPLIGVYAGAYFALSDRTDDVHSARTTRWFESKWIEVVFKPAAFVETKLTHSYVDSCYFPFSEREYDMNEICHT